MGIAGRLTRADLKYSTPADSPLYPPPPYEYPSADLIVIDFETDAEAAARLLPESAELDDIPRAGLVFADYPTSTIGPYGEVLLYIHARYRGQAVQYAARFYVTTDIAMAAGREQAGIPKKMGVIRFGVPGSEKLAPGQVVTGSLERPAGTPIVSGSFRLLQSIPLPSPLVPSPQTFHYLALRVIPSPILGAAPSLCELVETLWVMKVSEVWAAELDGPLVYGPDSAVDSLAGLPIRDPAAMKVSFLRGDMRVDFNPPPPVVSF